MSFARPRRHGHAVRGELAALLSCAALSACLTTFDLPAADPQGPPPPLTKDAASSVDGASDGASCSASAPCPAGAVCHFDDGRCGAGLREGRCVAIEAACDAAVDPLSAACGCNGQLYLSRCDAARQNVDVSSEPACGSGSESRLCGDRYCAKDAYCATGGTGKAPPTWRCTPFPTGCAAANCTCFAPDPDCKCMDGELTNRTCAGAAPVCTPELTTSNGPACKDRAALEGEAEARCAKEASVVAGFILEGDCAPGWKSARFICCK